MFKPDLKLALENAQRSILEDKYNRAVSKMTSAQQKEFFEKVMTELPGTTLVGDETPQVEEKIPEGFTVG